MYLEFVKRLDPGLDPVDMVLGLLLPILKDKKIHKHFSKIILKLQRCGLRNFNRRIRIRNSD